jgi:hypothetical protein
MMEDIYKGFDIFYDKKRMKNIENFKNYLTNMRVTSKLIV